MSFQWQHFLDLAEDLLKRQATLRAGAITGDVASDDATTTNLTEQTTARAADESALRTCISRAYYAAFHIVREYVEMMYPNQGAPTKVDSHISVWKQLDSRNRRQEGAIQNNGNAIKRARQAADYDLGFPKWDQKSGIAARNWIELAEFSILTARRIQKLVVDITPQR